MAKEKTKSLNSSKIKNDITEDIDKNETDILGNRQLVKKVVKRGLGRESRPTHGDLVKVKYSAMMSNGSIVLPETVESVVLGDADLLQALELTFPLTERNETFQLNASSRFCYGEIGHEHVPPNTDLIITGELLECNSSPNFFEWTLEDRLKMADKKREKGNFYYRREEYPYALNCYDKALKVLNSVDNETSEEPKFELLMKLWNNLAATQIKLSAYDSAIKSCEEILIYEPNNHKALFRKGKANLSLGNTNEAIPLFECVLQLVPNSQLAKTELDKAKRQLILERKQLAKAASKWLPIAPHLRKDVPVNSKLSFFKNNFWKFLAALMLLVSMLFGAFIVHGQAPMPIILTPAPNMTSSSHSNVVQNQS